MSHRAHLVLLAAKKMPDVGGLTNPSAKNPSDISTYSIKSQNYYYWPKTIICVNQSGHGGTNVPPPIFRIALKKLQGGPTERYLTKTACMRIFGIFSVKNLLVYMRQLINYFIF